MPFLKMEGIGNDYVYIDARESAPRNVKKLAQQMSDRHFGVGSDGLILIRKSRVKAAKHRMQMFNADGSESEMCGNGLRCVAKYLFDRKLESNTDFPIETGAGLLDVKVFDRDGVALKVQINMGEPILERADIPMTGKKKGLVVGESININGKDYKFTAVSMGNPHCIIFVNKPASNELVHTVGPLIENHKLFPNRTNVEFVYKESEKILQQRTWERGSGETLACGTGASAVAVAAQLNGITGRRVKIKLLGGDLQMYWNESDNCVYMTGPAREVFSGVWPA
ncbi:MAG: diaminopimelate epimerase [Planctomycetes bacterium]|nr:diaminopimelate epimerase [Planctomycetota bacterium]